jgi:hypothetical protein
MWSTTSDVRAFLIAAGAFLEADPVAHTVLLTEAAYLTARPHLGDDQRYGWWQVDGDPVAGAFLQAPRHAPILSTMPAAALGSLVDLLPDLPPIGVDGRLVDPAVTAWREHGIELAERSRITLHRLGDLHAPTRPPPGRARVATPADRDVLVGWYERMMAAFPDDPSELAYVVDDPIGYGGITLWEVDGTPMAMAGRSRVVAGMVRLGAIYAPDHGDDHGRAALVAACEAAQAVARDVLIFSGGGDDGYRTLGFEPVLDRVMLAP